jgi:hypothetical protein
MTKNERLDVSKIDLEKHFFKLKSQTLHKIHGAGKLPFTRGESSSVFTIKKIDFINLKINETLTGTYNLIELDSSSNRFISFNELENLESLSINDHIFYSSNKNIKRVVELFLELTNKFPKTRFHLGIELEGNICNDIAVTKALRIYISDFMKKPLIVGIINTDDSSKAETLIFNSYLSCIEKIVSFNEKIDIEKIIDKTHNYYKLNSPIDPFYGNSEIIKQTNNFLNLLNKKHL